MLLDALEEGRNVPSSIVSNQLGSLSREVIRGRQPRNRTKVTLYGLDQQVLERDALFVRILIAHLFIKHCSSR